MNLIKIELLKERLAAIRQGVSDDEKQELTKLFLDKLKKQGKTKAEFAAENGIHRTTLINQVKGRRTYYAVLYAMALYVLK